MTATLARVCDAVRQHEIVKICRFYTVGTASLVASITMGVAAPGGGAAQLQTGASRRRASGHPVRAV